MENKILITYSSLMERYQITQLTGAELYQKYGIKRDEVLFGDDVKFDDGYTLEIEMLTGKENERPDYRIQLVSPDGTIVADVSEDYDNDTLLGTFTATDDDTGKVYSVHMNMERCAVPIRHTESDESVTIAYCDSDWLVRRFDSHEDNLIRFLHEYTSDEAAGLIGDAILAHAVAFFYNEEKDEPFSFYGDEGWKYRAFADVISDWLNKNHTEAAKALDCFLNL